MADGMGMAWARLGDGTAWDGMGRHGMAWHGMGSRSARPSSLTAVCSTAMLMGMPCANAGRHAEGPMSRSSAQ